MQRKLPAPGFHVEIVMIESDDSQPTKPKSDSSHSTVQQPQSSSGTDSGTIKSEQSRDDDDVFSDSDGEGNSKGVESHSTSKIHQINESPKIDDHSADRSVTNSSSSGLSNEVLNDSLAVSDFKAIAADASVFSFGDEEEDYESD